MSLSVSEIDKTASPGSGKRGVTPIEFIGAVLLLSAAAFFALRWGIDGAIHNRKVVVVPEIKGKSISGALDILAPENLSLLKDGAEFNSAVPIGSILRQRPPGGTKVREGKVIRVVVSQGGETVFTPSVSGLPLRNAEMLLRQNQLTLGEVSESYSLRLEKGLVLSQDPKSESSVERNSLVNVVVSGGAPPEGINLMPDFLHKNLSDANKWAAQIRARLSIIKDAGSLFPNGTILTQDPASDAVLAQNASVRLSVSGRPEAGQIEPSMKAFNYQVPQGSSESLVRILLADQNGERELFNGMRAPGSKIDVPIPESGRARMKIFLNGILVEEHDL